MEVNYFETIPSEIKVNIFKYLNIKDIAESQLVCKDWKEIIKNNEYITYPKVKYLFYYVYIRVNSGKFKYIDYDILVSVKLLTPRELLSEDENFLHDYNKNYKKIMLKDYDKLYKHATNIKEIFYVNKTNIERGLQFYYNMFCSILINNNNILNVTFINTNIPENLYEFVIEKYKCCTVYRQII